MSEKRLHILVLTTLFPNGPAPHHGIFVANRLRALCARHPVGATVIAPVPFFPLPWRIFGRYGRFARVPKKEVIEGLTVYHPRYLVIPKVGMALTPFTLAYSMLRMARQLIRAGQAFDLIDAHYLYPDGLAAAQVAGKLNLPYVATARGSDVTTIARMGFFRRWMRRGLRGTAHMICVSGALRDALLHAGFDAGKVSVLRNGVDADRFSPQLRRSGREKYALTGPVVLFAGGLNARKRVDLALGAIARLPEATLLIAGEGALRARLERDAVQMGISGRVRFLGAQQPDDIPELMAAADALILPSEREGWANVTLEAMAAGTPVVASEAGAAPELAQDPLVCRRVAKQQAESYSEALAEILEAHRSQPMLRERVRSFAEKYSWDSTSDGQYAIFNSVLEQSGHTGEKKYA